MRLLFVSSLILLLAACSPGNTGPTFVSAPVETETGESTLTPIPTETLTFTPEPTLEPTATEEPTVVIIESVEIDGVSLPEDAVMLLRQEGGFMGLDQASIVYPDGRILKEGNSSGRLDPEILIALLDEIEASGFFEIEDHVYFDYCCDFFSYTLIIRHGDKMKGIKISEADPDMPEGLQVALSAVRELINTEPEQ
jgi:hypothetical protein